MGGLSGKRPEGLYRTSDEGLPKDERYAPLDAESVAAFAAPVWTRWGWGDSPIESSHVNGRTGSRVQP
jgi:hypothetical protein